MDKKIYNFYVFKNHKKNTSEKNTEQISSDTKIKNTASSE